jgi:hypothetical protein
MKTIMINEKATVKANYETASEAQANIGMVGTVGISFDGISISKWNTKVRNSKFENSKQKQYVKEEQLQNGKVLDILLQVKKDCNILDSKVKTVDEAIEAIKAVYEDNSNNIKKYCMLVTKKGEAVAPISLSSDAKYRIIDKMEPGKSDVKIGVGSYNVTFFEPNEAQKSFGIASLLSIECNGIKILSRAIKIKNSEKPEERFKVSIDSFQNGRILDVISKVKKECTINKSKVKTVLEAIELLEGVYGDRTNDVKKTCFLTDKDGNFLSPVFMSTQAKKTLIATYTAYVDMENGVATTDEPEQVEDVKPELSMEEKINMIIKENEKLKKELAKSKKTKAKKAPAKAKADKTA